jgi:periplasmic protein TonB
MAALGGTSFAVASSTPVGENISTTQIPLQMTETTLAAPLPVNTSAGHLSVHIEGDHPADVPFLLEEQQKRLGPAAAASLAYHIVATIAIFFLIRYSPTPTASGARLPEKPNDNIVWLQQEGPGGGGGGGGNQRKEQPKQAEEIGKDKITVPVQKPPKLEPPQQPPKAEPNPVQQLTVPAMSMAAAAESLPGAIEAPTGPPTISQGSGKGGGAGTGSGVGIGPGTGSGLGPGSGGNTGGGPMRPGSGVTNPRVLHEVKPQYTSDAMRAKIQGTVLLECIVKPDGSVGDVQVLRSLDPTFGLDQEAIKAARQWRFTPGMHLGEAVPVIVTIELQFTLR